MVEWLEYLLLCLGCYFARSRDFLGEDRRRDTYRSLDRDRLVDGRRLRRRVRRRARWRRDLWLLWLLRLRRLDSLGDGDRLYRYCLCLDLDVLCFLLL